MEYACGPHEIHYNENNEQMFRGIKVRNLGEMFEKVPEYRDYTLDQFKVWMKEQCPEEDWTYINMWGSLYRFNSILLDNKDIFDYLFQLGMEPFSLYLRSIQDIERLENRLKEPKCEYRNTRIKLLKKAKEFLKISSKYISQEEINYALEIKDIDYF